MAKKAILNVGGLKLGWVGIILIAAIALFVVAPMLGISTGLPMFSIAGTGQTVPPQAVPSTPVSCDSTTTPAVTFTVLDSIKNGTNLTSDYNQYVYVNGFLYSSGAAGTAIAANPNDALTVYFIDADATHDVYGFIETLTVPCQEVVTVNTTRGMQDGSLTTTVYQSDDVTQNTAGAPEAIGAGGTAEGRIRIKEATDDGYWSTNETGQKFLLTTDVNKAIFSDFEITSTSPAVSFVEVSTPSSHTSSDPTNYQLTVSYELEGSLLKDLGLIDIYFRAPALGSVNPTNDANLLFTIMDKELYLNTNTGVWVVDYYNAVTNADVGETNATDVYHIS